MTPIGDAMRRVLERAQEQQKQQQEKQRAPRS